MMLPLALIIDLKDLTVITYRSVTVRVVRGLLSGGGRFCFSNCCSLVGISFMI